MADMRGGSGGREVHETAEGGEAEVDEARDEGDLGRTREIEGNGDCVR